MLSATQVRHDQVMISWAMNHKLSLSMSDFNIHCPSAKYQRWVDMLVPTPIIVCLLCRYSMLSCFFFKPVKFLDLGSSWVKISPEKLYCFALLSETSLHQGFCRYYQGTYSSEPDYKTYSVKVITVLDLMYLLSYCWVTFNGEDVSYIVFPLFLELKGKRRHLHAG